MSAWRVRALAGSIVVVFLVSMRLHGTAIDELLARPHVLFRNTGPGASFGRLTVAPLDHLETRLPTALSCERVSFARGAAARADRGLCLRVERGVFNRYSAVLVDAHLNGGAATKLQGLPSRTRASADGRVAAITVFV